jgi:hypothetical protein
VRADRRSVPIAPTGYDPPRGVCKFGRDRSVTRHRIIWQTSDPFVFRHSDVLVGRGPPWRGAEEEVNTGIAACGRD